MLTEDFNRELMTTAEIIQAAADGAKAGDIRKPSTNHLRASRAGLPLVQLVLEDLILPNLETEHNKPAEADMGFHMRIAGGHLYEAVAGYELKSKYKSVANNVSLTWKDIEGHCDYLASNDGKSHVYECKSLNVYGIKDAEEKVLYDNWGYFTQLSIYYASVGNNNDHKSCNASWLVWCKRTGKQVEIPYPHSLEYATLMADAAQDKSNDFVHIYSLLKAGEITEAIDNLFSVSEELPERMPHNTSFYNSCGLHFHWSSDLIVDKREGLMLDSAYDNVLTMANAAFALDELVKKESQQHLKKLVDKKKKVR